jgi:hypothetical protein
VEDKAMREVEEGAISSAGLKRLDGEFIECHSCRSKGSTGVTGRSSVDVAEYLVLPRSGSLVRRMQTNENAF